MLKMLDIQKETLIAFRDLPAWCQKNIGRRISPSTLHRWRLRGCRGVKLQTLLLGGQRTTSVEALQRFFSASTLAQDGENEPSSRTDEVTDESHDSVMAYLDREGI